MFPPDPGLCGLERTVSSGNHQWDGNEMRNGEKQRRGGSKELCEMLLTTPVTQIILIIPNRYSFCITLQPCYNKTMTSPRPPLLLFQTNIPINKPSRDIYQL